MVIIGEEGSGDIEFMLKSQFGNASLTPLVTPTRVYPDEPTELSYVSNNASLENAQLSYTINNWTNAASVNMSISNQTCNTTIPGQSPGSIVQYRVEAKDALENNMTATGNYKVKQPSALNITAVKDHIILGETSPSQDLLLKR